MTKAVQHVLEVPDHTGHSITKWDPSNAEEVSIAKATFDALIAAGKRIFAVEGDNNQGRPITTFEASIARMMVLPQLKGG